MRSTRGRGAPWRLAFVLSAISLLGAAGCREKAMPIRDLLSNTAVYDGQTVRVAGKVESAAGAFGYGVYQVEDGTGKVTVVTKQRGAPATGAEVGVEGTFRTAFTIGTDVVAVIEETKRYEP